jgi:hypothetical protein
VFWIPGRPPPSSTLFRPQGFPKPLGSFCFDVEIDEDTYRRERDETQVVLDALVIPEEPDVVAAGQFLETFADIWVEAIPKERKELLGLLL